MKIVAALDSFKGSLTSWQAGEAVRRGILCADPCAEVVVLPLADGGEGTVDALTSAMGGTLVELEVTGPLGTPVAAVYGRIGDTAVMEMAQAAGLPLVPPERRNPMHTTTRGVGEMIAHAAAAGCRDFLIGIGGSATNDGGMGMLAALGVIFRDEAGEELRGYGEDLIRLATIDTTNLLPILKSCRFRIACDVDNPLCGPKGASAVYGPQKGLDPTGIQIMDAALQRYAQLTGDGSNYINHPGAGAAGGLGFAFLSYLNGELKSGVELVMDTVGFPSAISGADYLITGEGRMDSQTAMGKAPAGAAAAAKAHGAKVLALVGSVRSEHGRNCQGMDAVFPIQPGPVALAEAMDLAFAAQNLADTAEQIFRLINITE